MQYIPKSYIHYTQELNTIQKIHGLNEDVITLIIEFYGKELNPNGDKDDFWIRLGKETCNMQIWAKYCYDILIHSFGTSKFHFVLETSNELFLGLCNTLDKLIQEYYPRTTLCVQHIPVIDIFYSSGNIPLYPRYRFIKYEKRKKHLTHQETQYISTFRERLLAYTKYFKTHLSQFPVQSHTKSKIILRQHKQINTIIRKLTKNVDKLKNI